VPAPDERAEQTARRYAPALIAVIVGVVLCLGIVLVAVSVLSSLTGRVVALPSGRAPDNPTATPATTVIVSAPGQAVTITADTNIAAADTATANAIATNIVAAIATDTPTQTPTPVPSDTPTVPACQQGQAAITSPAPNAVLRGTVPVMGTAMCNGFAYYKFEFVDSRCGPSGLCFVAGKFTQPVENGLLMNWDTTRTWNGQHMPNGTYTLRMTVVGQDNSPLQQMPEVRITISNP
jgi:hypothetical protein